MKDMQICLRKSEITMRFGLALFYFGMGAFFVSAFGRVATDDPVFTFMALGSAMFILGGWLSHMLESHMDEARSVAVMLPPEEEYEPSVFTGPSSTIEPTVIIDVAALIRGLKKSGALPAGAADLVEVNRRHMALLRVESLPDEPSSPRSPDPSSFRDEPCRLIDLREFDRMPMRADGAIRDNGEQAGLHDLRALEERARKIMEAYPKRPPRSGKQRRNHPPPVPKHTQRVMGEASHLQRQREAARLIDVRAESESALNAAIDADKRRRAEDT